MGCIRHAHKIQHFDGAPTRCPAVESLVKPQSLADLLTNAMDR
jgi:hypothetical protein